MQERGCEVAHVGLWKWMCVVGKETDNALPVADGGQGVESLAEHSERHRWL